MNFLSVESWALALESLTRREREVKRLVAQGLANKVIAAELGVSQRTIEAHRARVFRKLQVRNAVELTHALLLQRSKHQLAEPASKLLADPPLSTPDDQDPE